MLGTSRVGLSPETIAPAKSDELMFDDIDVGVDGAVFMPISYGGLTWSDAWAVMDPSEYVPAFPRSGFFNGVTSGEQVAYNNRADPLSITAKTFDIESVNLTAGWDKVMLVEIVASRHGRMIFDQTFTVGDRKPTHIDLDLRKIDSLVFVATEVKVDPKSGGNGAYMVFDDIEISHVKPLAAAFAPGEDHGATPSLVGHHDWAILHEPSHAIVALA